MEKTSSLLDFMKKEFDDMKLSKNQIKDLSKVYLTVTIVYVIVLIVISKLH
jgi:hypothetical protein